VSAYSVSRDVAESALRPGRFHSGLPADEDAEEFGDLDVAFEGVTEVGIRLQAVAIAASLPLMGQVAGLFEFGDDPLGGALGDADTGCDVAKAYLRLSAPAASTAATSSARCAKSALKIEGAIRSGMNTFLPALF